MTQPIKSWREQIVEGRVFELRSRPLRITAAAVTWAIAMAMHGPLATPGRV